MFSPQKKAFDIFRKMSALLLILIKKSQDHAFLRPLQRQIECFLVYPSCSVIPPLSLSWIISCEAKMFLFQFTFFKTFERGLDFPLFWNPSTYQFPPMPVSTQIPPPCLLPIEPRVGHIRPQGRVCPLTSTPKARASPTAWTTAPPTHSPARSPRFIHEIWTTNVYAIPPPGFFTLRRFLSVPHFFLTIPFSLRILNCWMSPESGWW